MRYNEIICEAGDPYNGSDYWTPDQTLHMAKYARTLSFKSKQEAYDWVFDKLQYWDEQRWSSNGQQKNRIIADVTPLYLSGKSFKIGMRIRMAPAKPWQGIEIIRPALWPLEEVGLINPFDGYAVLGVRMVPVRTLHMTEDHSRTEQGEDTVYQYAARIKEDKTFLAIIVDTAGAILDGHHRFRAVRDVMKWKKIAALVIRLG